MNYYETIILCQPNSQKSCSACCGLFNFRDISRENLSRFLRRGAARSSSFAEAGNIADQGDGLEVRDATSYICPHQGLIFNKRPGCLLHPQYRTSTMRNKSFFGETICDGFLCPAHAIFTTEQKKIIIDLADDWYTYTIAIIDPESTVWLLDLLHGRYPIAFQREEVLKKIFNEALMIHSRHMADYSGPLFYYSESEYNGGKKNYSLVSESARTENEKQEIIKAIENNL
jgi:hypothetical protein